MNIINIKVLQNNLSSVQFSCSVVSDSATPWTLKSSSFSVLFFAFSYCSWGSQSKNTEVVCHSLLQCLIVSDLSTMSSHLGWPHTAWLNFIELDKLWPMWSDWLDVCDCGLSLSALWCPLSVPTVLLGFLLPWEWGIFSRLLWQSTATAPVSMSVVYSCDHMADWSCGSLLSSSIRRENHTAYH